MPLDADDRAIVESYNSADAIKREIRAHEAFIERRKYVGDDAQVTEEILTEHEELVDLLKARLAVVTGVSRAEPGSYDG